MSVTAVLRTNRRLAAGVLTAVAVASLAACGSSDTSDSSGSGSNGTTNGDGNGRGGGGRMAAYIQCLAQNGVTITMPSGGPNGGAGMPSGAPPSGAANGAGAPSGAPNGAGMPSGGPGGGGGRELTKPDGVDDATWTKATTACASQKPTGGGNGANPTASAN